MKKILFSLLLLVILSPILVKAVSLSGINIVSDSYVKIGENIELNLIADGDISLSPDTFFFFVEYSDDIFEFVSYEGFDGTVYTESEKKLSADNYDFQNVIAGDTVGVLTLKVKSTLKEAGSSVINYYSNYEYRYGEGSRTINYTLGSSNNEEPTNGDQTDKELINEELTDEVNYTSLNNPYFITTILATSAALVFSLATVVLVVKNKKIKK